MAVTHEVAHAEHEHPQSFWKKYIFSQDHKIIGIQYLMTSLFMALIGATVALVGFSRLQDRQIREIASLPSPAPSRND